jgi:hypothetical protein
LPHPRTTHSSCFSFFVSEKYTLKLAGKGSFTMNSMDIEPNKLLWRITVSEHVASASPNEHKKIEVNETEHDQLMPSQTMHLEASL